MLGSDEVLENAVAESTNKTECVAENVCPGTGRRCREIRLHGKGNLLIEKCPHFPPFDVWLLEHLTLLWKALHQARK